MNRVTFVGGTVVLADRLGTDLVVDCQDGRIESVGPATSDLHDGSVVDLSGGFLVPGYIDLHVHGGDGADFMDGTVAAVRRACAAHLRHGTTTIFPTTTTGSSDQIHAVLNACRCVIAEDCCPNIAGVHLYGPYFAEDKVGCHSPEGRRSPVEHEYAGYLDSGIVRIATCAAELPGAEHFYHAAMQRGCLVTCGHSNASWSEMQSAFDAGMRHVDHFWCAMSSVPSLRQRFGTPMQASMAEFVVMNQDMSTEVIADGFHLSRELLEFAYRIIGPQRLCLVTDCNRALDMPPGDYRFGNCEDGSWLKSDGCVGWAPDGNSLASSVVGMDHMVRYMVSSTSASLPEVVRMASLTPAQRTGIAHETGSIAVGKKADLLVLDQDLNVRKVFVEGKQVFEQPC